MKLISSFRTNRQQSSTSPIVRSIMDLDHHQKNAIKQLHSRIGHKLPPALNSDYELYKWLAARNFDVDKAEEMIEKTLIWRKEYDIDSLLEWDPPEVLKKYSPVGQPGYDKEGSPVWIIPFGHCDLRGIFHSCTERDYIRYQMLVLEKSLKYLRKHYDETKKIIKQVSIFDMENYSLRTVTWKPTRDALLKMVQIYESNYPELLKCCYVVNTPKFFTTVMAIVKPFVQQETLDKIKFFGSTGWKQALLETISADQLPVHWGGSLRDADGNTKCQSMINLGGEVPHSYYLKKKSGGSGMNQNAKNSMKSLIVPKGGKETLKFEVKQSASSLNWEFFTDDFDVGFGISRLLPHGVEEVLLAQHRVNCQTIPDEGSLCCIDPGTYEVTFDNEYSYLRAKKVYYKMEVVPPSDVTKF